MALFTGIVTAVGSAAKVAELFAEDAKNETLIDAGKAQQNADDLNALFVKLQRFEAAADRLDIDPEFARIVRDAFEDPD